MNTQQPPTAEPLAPLTGSASDSGLLTYLETLLRECPGVVIRHNDDPDIEDALGMVPVGYSIRTDGCAGVWTATGETLRAAIIEDMKLQVGSVHHEEAMGRPNAKLSDAP